MVGIFKSIRVKLKPVRKAIRWQWFRFKHWSGAMVYVENPLLKYPRNMQCWCGKEYKAKMCCLPRQAPVVEYQQGLVLRGYMAHVLVKEQSNALN